MGKYKRMMQAVFTSGFAFVISCLINLILTPYVTEVVGIVAYGFVSLSKNFYSYAMILSEALNSFSSRYVVLSHHEGDDDTANIYFASTFYGNVFISIIVSVVGLLLVCFCDKFLKIPLELLDDVRWLFVMTIGAYVVTILGSVFMSSSLIVQKLNVVGIFKTISYIAEAVTLIICYRYFYPNIWYVGLSSLFAAIVIGVSNYYLSRKYTPYLAVKRKYYRKHAVVTLVKDGVWTSLTSLGTMLNSGLDLLMCNLMLLPENMGQIAVAKTLYGMFANVFVIISTAFQPMLLKSYAEKNEDAFKQELNLAMKLSGLFSNLLFAGFFAFGLVFYKLWIPKQDVQLIYWLTVVNNLVVIPSGPMYPLYYIYILTLKKKLPTIITILSGFCNVIGMYFLIKYTSLGVYAVVWTTVVVMMFVNFVSNPLYMAHILGYKWWYFYPNILRNVISCGILCVVFYGIAFLIKPQTWLWLIFAGLLSVMAGMILHVVITCSKHEKQMINTLVKSKLLRVKDS